VTPEETRALVERSYAAVNARDLDGFLAAMDPEIEVRSLVLRPAKGGDAFVGHTGVREWWKAMFGTQDLELTLVRMRVDGDRAAIELLLHNDVGGVAADHTMFHGARFRDGRVRSFGLYPSEAEAAAAVDLADGAGVLVEAEDAR
jgi:ketosteroid isomerase-like protein